MRPTLVAIISGILLTSSIQAKEPFKPRCLETIQCEDFRVVHNKKMFQYQVKVRTGDTLLKIVTFLNRYQPELTVDVLAEENGLLIIEEDMEHSNDVGEARYKPLKFGGVITYTYEY